MKPPDWEAQWRLALRWFQVAETDVLAARFCMDGKPPLIGIAAYHCQQAAEKILKGLLIRAARPVRKTHNLDAIADEVIASTEGIADRIAFCRIFTSWGMLGRYPQAGQPDTEPPTAEQVGETAKGLAQLLEFARHLGSKTET
ncbi:MAG: HEPN domain-containing protein [Alphaproteobacteria bacterium]